MGLRGCQSIGPSHKHILGLYSPRNVSVIQGGRVLSYKSNGDALGKFSKKNTKEVPRSWFVGVAWNFLQSWEENSKTKYYLLSYVFYFRVRILKRTLHLSKGFRFLTLQRYDEHHRPFSMGVHPPPPLLHQLQPLCTQSYRFLPEYSAILFTSAWQKTTSTAQNSHSLAPRIYT